MIVKVNIHKCHIWNTYPIHAIWKYVWLTFSSKTRSGKLYTQWNKSMCRMTNIFHKHHIWKIISWNSKIYIQRLIFSSDTYDKISMPSKANSFHKCYIWNTCYFHENGKCVFKRLTFSTNVASEGLVTIISTGQRFPKVSFSYALLSHYIGHWLYFGVK